MATLPELGKTAENIDMTGAIRIGAIGALLGGLNAANFAALTAADAFRQTIAQRAAEEAAATMAAKEDPDV